MPAASVKMEMNCDVERVPTAPRIRSPRKNSMMNRPTEYRIRYQAPTSPLNFFRFAIQHRKKNIPKSNNEEISWLGNRGIPAGASPPSGNVMPHSTGMP